MQLPLELMTQMAGAGMPLMAAPAAGAPAHEADTLVQAGQFSDLLNQALSAQAGTQPQAAPQGDSLLNLLQMTTPTPGEMPVDVPGGTTGSTPADASAQPAETGSNLSWLSVSAPATPATPPQAPAVDPALQTATAASGETLLAMPDMPAEAPATSPMPVEAAQPAATEPEPANGNGSACPAEIHGQAVAQAAHDLAPGHQREKTAGSGRDLHASEKADTEIRKPETAAPGTALGASAETGPQAAVPEAQHPALDPAALPQPGPVALPVSILELQIRAAQVPVTTPPVRPATPEMEALLPVQPLQQTLPPALPPAARPASAPEASSTMQPAFHGMLAQAGNGKPALQPNSALAPQPADAASIASETDSLPLPPPPVTETPAKGEKAPDVDLPLAVSVVPPGPVGEKSRPASPSGLNGIEVLTQAAGDNPPAEAADIQATSPPDHRPPVEMPAEIEITVAEPGHGEFTAPETPASQPVLPVAGAPTGGQTTEAAGKAPAPAAPVFQPTAESLGDQVVEGTAYSVKNGHRELTIRLNPENLGEVRVNLVSRNVGGATELSARLIASNPESHEALQQQLHQLKDSLEAQGVKIERLSVVMASAADTRNETRQGGDFGHQFSQQQQSTPQQAPDQGFNRDAQPGFNMGQQGHEGAGHPNYGTRNRYASVPGPATGSGPETIQRPEAPVNENGRISLLA